MSRRPLCLIGGLDPTGGAGVLRDVLAAHAVAPTLPVRVVVSAWTVQGEAAALARCVGIDDLLFSLSSLAAPSAIKLGLVPDDLHGPVGAWISQFAVPIVVDPVVRASDGGSLGATFAALVGLMRRATLITPNRAEADAIAAELDVEPSAAALAHALGGVAVLIKTASVSRDHVVDELWAEGVQTVFEHARGEGADPRGTGCALATAIGCQLATGDSILDAVRCGILWLGGQRNQARRVGAATFLP